MSADSERKQPAGEEAASNPLPGRAWRETVAGGRRCAYDGSRDGKGGTRMSEAIRVFWRPG